MSRAFQAFCNFASLFALNKIIITTVFRLKLENLFSPIRASHLKEHEKWYFGGRIDPLKQLETALREANEEIGIENDNIFF